jgi:hypothetical protein
MSVKLFGFSAAKLLTKDEARRIAGGSDCAHQRQLRTESHF